MGWKPLIFFAFLEKKLHDFLMLFVPMFECEVLFESLNNSCRFSMEWALRDFREMYRSPCSASCSFLCLLQSFGALMSVLIFVTMIFFVCFRNQEGVLLMYCKFIMAYHPPLHYFDHKPVQHFAAALPYPCHFGICSLRFVTGITTLPFLRVSFDAHNFIVYNVLESVAMWLIKRKRKKKEAL